ncbi:uncharacterized protein LOC130180044 [Seriola aureovittata]|uniref:uncharacterized protein LOC130180044 n=1 Tax=Seriola aureovittata TaxID=2871759 RepID=UPI0024BE4C81|nr:uncharacterized protein LOC130180044 [Seriola aureovittata]
MLVYESQLLTEMEVLTNIRKMTSEERRKHFREEMYRELRELEEERRARVALEELERRRREKEKETERVNSLREQVEERKRRQKRRRRNVLMAEEPITRPRFTLSDLKEVQQRRREEAEAAQRSLKSPTSEVRSQEQSGRKPLINNWVGEQTPEEELHPTDSTHHRPAAKGTRLKSEKAARLMSSRALHWLQKRLQKSGLFVKKQEEVEKKKEACLSLKDLYPKNSLCEQVHSYRLSRNSILKKTFS